MPRVRSISPVSAMLPSSRGVVLPIHLQIVGEVGPAVAGAHVTAGKLRESASRAQRQVNVVAVGEQEVPALGLHDLAVVVPAADLQMRSAQHVQVQPPLPLGSDVELGVNQQAVQVRIADDLLFDDVAAFGIACW